MWLGSDGTWAAECGGGTEDTNIVYSISGIFVARKLVDEARRARGEFLVYSTYAV